MPYALACQQDPVALGIQHADGSWDMAEFSVHLRHCVPCRSFRDRLTDEVGMALEETWSSGRPTGGTLALSASAELVIREVIDLLAPYPQVQRARALLEALVRTQGPPRQGMH